jgi:hypothetical protein
VQAPLNTMKCTNKINFGNINNTISRWENIKYRTLIHMTRVGMYVHHKM